MIGASLAQFRITAKLGEGGMGEVYLGEDSKLGREVAIKVLPEEVTGDPDRLARFHQEARLLAALNHPRIAAVYEAGESELVPSEPASDRDEPAASTSRSVHFLVMELVPGETLEDRLRGGPLAVREAVRIAAQIAEALEAAHGRAIVHRDLKPANIKLDASGDVKVLDFGLAKLTAPANDSAADLAHAPTIELAPTRTGMVVGTAPYMSPEQARGLPVDAQTDIWAFGCVLFEMLSGHRTFAGGSFGDTLARILEREPDWSKLPAETPRRLERLLRRCLAKEKRQRTRHIGDVLLDLEDLDSTIEPDRSAATRSIGLRLLPWAVAAVATLAGGWLLSERVGESPPAPLRLSVRTNPLAFGSHPAASVVALSPDGRTLAFIADLVEDEFFGSGQLYLRSLGSFDVRPVAGAERVHAPFFSPDSRWIGFFSEGAIRKAPLIGGTSQVVCETDECSSGVHGATWGADGTIVFSSKEGIYRVSAAGGEVDLVAVPDGSAKEAFLIYPSFLPDSDRILVTAMAAGGAQLGIDLLSLESGERSRLVEGGSAAVMLAPGVLAFAMEGSLWRVEFDADLGRSTGTPEEVLGSLLMGSATDAGVAHFATSREGTLVYVPGPHLQKSARLVRVDRGGVSRPVGGRMRTIFGPRFAPEGGRIAMSAALEEAEQRIWVFDLERETVTSLGFAEGGAWWPLWTRDGRRLVFTGLKERESWAGLFWGPADGAEAPVALVEERPYVLNAQAWTADGSTLIAHRSRWPSATEWDLLRIRPELQPSIERLVATPAFEYQASLSPDDRWLAYVSEDSGRPEVFVTSMAGGGRWQVSTGGGTEPSWSPDGTEIFYRSSSSMMSVSFAIAGSVRLGRPESLFDDVFVRGPQYGRNYDVAPDGSGFVMVGTDVEDFEATEIRVVRGLPPF